MSAPNHHTHPKRALEASSCYWLHARPRKDTSSVRSLDYTGWGRGNREPVCTSARQHTLGTTHDRQENYRKQGACAGSIPSSVAQPAARQGDGNEVQCNAPQHRPVKSRCSRAR